MSISIAMSGGTAYSGGSNPYSFAFANYVQAGFGGGFVGDLANSQQAMVRYTNDTGNTVKISSIRFYLGSGKAGSEFHWGSGSGSGTTVASGASVKLRLSYGSGNYQSSSSTVSGYSSYVTMTGTVNYVGGGSGSGGLNTDVRSDISRRRTFTFSPAISVANGGKIWFNIDPNNITIGSGGNAANTPICFGLIAADSEEEIIDPTITITFNSNGGSGGPSTLEYSKSEGGTIPTSKPSKSVTLTYNPNASTGEVTPSTKDFSLSFLGWSTTKITSRAGTSDDVNYASGASISLKSDKTLYAVWGESSSIGTLPTYRTNGTPRISRSADFNKYKLDESTPWTTTENGSVVVTSSYKIWKNTTIYAKWMYRYLVNANGGYFTEVLEGSEDGYEKDEAKVQEFWKKHDYELNLPPETYNDSEGSHYTFTKLGSTAKYYVGDSSSTTRLYSLGSSVQSSENVPNDLYVYWGQETFKVRFRLGYGPEDDDGLGEKILKTVTVNYGEDVPSGQIPVPGKNNYYSNIRFWRDGPYGFQGWSGSYKNITHDSDVYALWEFCPIWILEIVNGNRTWVPYKPKEK